MAYLSKIFGLLWRTLSDSNARPSGSKNEFEILEAFRQERNYLSTLASSRLSAEVVLPLTPAKTNQIQTSCSVFVPFSYRRFPQIFAVQNLCRELSNAKVNLSSPPYMGSEYRWVKPRKQTSQNLGFSSPMREPARPILRSFAVAMSVPSNLSQKTSITRTYPILSSNAFGSNSESVSVCSSIASNPIINDFRQFHSLEVCQ